jgi:hypothetical protein
MSTTIVSNCIVHLSVDDWPIFPMGHTMNRAIRSRAATDRTILFSLRTLAEDTITNFHSHKDTIEVSNSEFADLSAVRAANVRIAATQLFHMAMMSSHWKVLI